MITMGVNHLEKSIKYYHEGLGFPKIESSPEVAFFTLNGSWLSLYGCEPLAEGCCCLIRWQRFNGFAFAHNVGSEIEVDQSIEQALTAGATLSKAAQKTSWGGYSGYFKDPEGYLWEVAFNPFFWVGPEDENE